MPRHCTGVQDKHTHSQLQHEDAIISYYVEEMIVPQSCIHPDLPNFHVQNEERPGYLRNDGNDFLNYTDDWYILGWKPDAYAVIYYKGNNDAWKGYGGATVYTR